MKSYFLILVLLTSITFAQNKEISKLPTDISLTNLQGKSVSLKTLKDGKSPIVLDFWATWCAPCIMKYDTMKDVIAQWEKETSVRLVIVSIDKSDQFQAIKKLVETKGWPFEVLLDPDQKLFSSINNGITSIPQSFFYNPEGELKCNKSGVQIVSENESAENDILIEIKKPNNNLKADLKDYYSKIKSLKQ